jgi:hypothetical protein
MDEPRWHRANLREHPRRAFPLPSPDGRGLRHLMALERDLLQRVLARLWNYDSSLAPSFVPSLAEREKVDGAMVALRIRDHRAKRMRAGLRPRTLANRARVIHIE